MMRVPTASARVPGCSPRLLLCVLLLLPQQVEGWLNDRTFIIPAKREAPGSIAQTISLDCTGSSPIEIVHATYGLPCTINTPGQKPCPAVEPGNYVDVMQTECEGKLKCDVSTCPCPKAANCAPSATGCAAKDPAKEYRKGVTVLYRCGPPSWGLEFIVLLFVGCGGYLALGVVYAQRVQGKTVGSAGGGGRFGALSVHPHAGRWAEVISLVVDGITLAKDGRRTVPLLRGGNAAAGRAAAGEKKEKNKKERKERGNEHSPRKEKKQKKEKQEKKVQQGALEEPLRASTAGEAAAAPAATSEGTAAGGGGRWVHVPT